MSQVKREHVAPFQFGQLAIRELSPDSLQEASIAEVEVSPGAIHPEARSTLSEKIYNCTRGEVNFTVDGREITLTRGDVLHVPKNTWFSYQNAGSDSALLTLVHIPAFSLEHEEFRHSET